MHGYYISPFSFLGPGTLKLGLPDLDVRGYYKPFSLLGPGTLFDNDSLLSD